MIEWFSTEQIADRLRGIEAELEPLREEHHAASAPTRRSGATGLEFHRASGDRAAQARHARVTHLQGVAHALRKELERRDWSDRWWA